MVKRYLVLPCLSVFLSLNVMADVTGYITPERNSSFDRDIYRALTFAGMARLNRPYRLHDIEVAIETIKASEPELAARLNREIRGRVDVAAVDSLQAIGSSTSDSSRPNTQGVAGQGGYQLSADTHWQAQSWLRLNASLLKGEDDNSLAGTMLSVGGAYAQLDVGYKPYWLSPLQGHSQLLSTQTKTMPSVSLSNPITFDSWGLRWNYEIALAQMSKQLTAFDGEYDDSRGPLLALFHLSIQPADWWGLGATRNFQFGGGKRDVSSKTLAKAFFDPRGADNDASVDEESGNQVAALSSQMHFTAPWPFTFNLELAGEDTSNNKAYQLGNPALSAGLYFPAFGFKALSATFEYSQWDNAWYVNNVYQEGYSHDGYILGHWAMQPQHEKGFAAPASSRYFVFDYAPNDQHRFILNGRSAKHQISQFQDYWALDAEYLWSLAHWELNVGYVLGENTQGEQFDEARLGIRWR